MKPQSIFWSLFLVVISQTLSFGQADSLDDGPPCPPFCGFKSYTFRTKGKQLFDPCGSPVILKGVNKMAVFDRTDLFGTTYFSEIAKTGANCVRIAWEMTSKVNSQTVVNPLSRLDLLITNAKQNKLIPIVGLWDYTTNDDGGFSKLDDYVAYWTRPAMLTLIRKHQTSLIINFGNEAATGNENDSTDLHTFVNAYQQAVQKMRDKGVLVPLMINGMGRGKSLQCFTAKGPDLLRADPRHNLIFSFHPYWPKAETDTAEDGQYIKNKFAAIQSVPINIMLGEVNKYGAFLNSATDPCSANGLIDYKQFVQLAEAQKMHWLIWEWGPGNGYYDTLGTLIHFCHNMDMTTNGLYSSLMAIPATPATTAPDDDRYWMKELAIDASCSIQKTAQKTFFIESSLKSCPNNN